MTPLLVSIFVLTIASSAHRTTFKHHKPDNGEHLQQMESSRFKSNISQSTYLTRHREFFEQKRHYQVLEKRRAGQPLDNLELEMIHEYTSEEKWLPTSAGLTGTFHFGVSIDEDRTVSSVVLNFEVLPTKCSDRDATVTIRHIQDETKIFVDGCKPRWATTTLKNLPTKFQTIKITCVDCIQNNVNFSRPYLNIHTTNATKTRIKRDNPPSCHVDNFYIDLYKLPAFNYIYSPELVNLYRCAGSCEDGNISPPYGSQNAFIKSEIDRGPGIPWDYYKVCCVPNQFETFHYLQQNDNKTDLKWYQIERFVVKSCFCV